jgi:hypothetical protein
MIDFQAFINAVLSKLRHARLPVGKPYGTCRRAKRYHGEEIFTKEFYEIKKDYIHANPAKAGIVEKEEEYLYSSAGDYYGIRKGLLDIEYD